jgi:hypothetical protein
MDMGNATDPMEETTTETSRARAGVSRRPGAGEQAVAGLAVATGNDY